MLAGSLVALVDLASLQISLVRSDRMVLTVEDMYKKLPINQNTAFVLDFRKIHYLFSVQIETFHSLVFLQDARHSPCSTYFVVRNWSDANRIPPVCTRIIEIRRTLLADKLPLHLPRVLITPPSYTRV